MCSVNVNLHFSATLYLGSNPTTYSKSELKMFVKKGCSNLLVL